MVFFINAIQRSQNYGHNHQAAIKSGPPKIVITIKLVFFTRVRYSRLSMSKVLFMGNGI